MSDLIKREDAKQAVYELLIYLGEEDINTVVETVLKEIPSAIVFCKECKHRPIKEDADGADFGFNIIAPERSSRCPCLVDDGWYSWMPKDDFFCGYGEREGE